MRIALLALLVSCSHPAPPAPPPPPPSQCPKMADHIISLMRAAKAAPQDIVDKTRNLLAKSCDGDHWTPDAQACFLAMTDLSQGDQCQEKLTPQQLDAVNKAVDAALPPKKAE
ncbi:MAG TPA: hypothetical protein VGM88_03530 [Kofleriaceae bacterium]|jgi:hypothetical protein